MEPKLHPKTPNIRFRFGWVISMRNTLAKDIFAVELLYHRIQYSQHLIVLPGKVESNRISFKDKQVLCPWIYLMPRSYSNDHSGPHSFLPKEYFSVVMGNFNCFERTKDTLIFSIRNLISHDNPFNKTSMFNDLMLVILNGSVPSNHPTVQPIPLNDKFPLTPGLMCRVSGWGFIKARVSDLLPSPFWMIMMKKATALRWMCWLLFVCRIPPYKMLCEL